MLKRQNEFSACQHFSFSGFEVMPRFLKSDPNFFDHVRWSPGLKVVCDFRTGQIFETATNDERRRRGLPVPWYPDLIVTEAQQPPVP
jgi:hypothetical protein